MRQNWPDLYKRGLKLYLPGRLERINGGAIGIQGSRENTHLLIKLETQLKILHLIKSASPQANILLVLSASLLLLKILILNKFEPLFTGAYSLGLMVESILASVIASYVFYLIVVHLKETNDRKTIAPYIAKHINRVILSCRAQVSAFSQAANTDLGFNALSKEELELALKKIPPYSEAPLSFGLNQKNANWFQYFEYQSNRTKSSIQRILQQLPFLEAELISNLAAIDDCNHVDTASFLANQRFNNTDLSVFSGQIYEYYTLNKKLESLLTKYNYPT
ncbi:hypothetical protein [Pseudomonas fluorescens]|uniref:hypothetical protein n=1 Tax=Pseudomonas fluorescens TaxID=294 RepID=UPI001639A1F0|nr:hypothetical protein [Pseudomonas fluorescens]